MGRSSVAFDKEQGNHSFPTQLLSQDDIDSLQSMGKSCAGAAVGHNFLYSKLTSLLLIFISYTSSQALEKTAI